MASLKEKKMGTLQTSYFICTHGRALGGMKRSLTPTIKRMIIPQSIPTGKPVYRPRALWMNGNLGPLVERSCYAVPKLILLIFLSAYPKGTYGLLPELTLLGGKGDTISLVITGHWFWTDAISRRMKCHPKCHCGILPFRVVVNGGQVINGVLLQTHPHCQSSRFPHSPAVISILQECITRIDLLTKWQNAECPICQQLRPILWHPMWLHSSGRSARFLVAGWLQWLHHHGMDDRLFLLECKLTLDIDLPSFHTSFSQLSAMSLPNALSIITVFHTELFLIKEFTSQ